MDAKEEVRARLNIEDVIGEYVQLKRAGRSFKGLSPFTSEKTPSFFVSPDKNIWHDFSSNKGGDVFAFVMEAEGMDFRQALEFLAKKAGVELSDYEPAHAKERAARKKRLLIANQLAARFYQQCLLHNQHAMEYVFRVRKLSKQVVADFQIGYAPDSGEALARALAKKGFSRRELNDAGLLNRFGGDMFRGRMMVPLMDSSGQVIGFTGRIIGDVPNAPKYLNTPQTLLYDKGRHIFALSQAKQAIRQAGFIVMVEGNLDVVSSHQVGIKNVVATAGTAMTEQHVRAVKRLTGDVRLAYDGDKAGVAATERAITLASQAGVELTIISLPEQYKDPDELIQADVSLWQRAIDTAEPAVDWILRQYAARLDLDTAAGKRNFTTAALGVIRLLSDPVEQEYYLTRTAELAQTSVETVRAKFAGSKTREKPLKPVAQSTQAVGDDAYIKEDNALALACCDLRCRGMLRRTNVEHWHEASRRVLALYLQSHDEIIQAVPKELQEYDIYVKIVLLRAEERYAAWSGEDRQLAMRQLLQQIEHEQAKQTQDSLLAQLRDAEAAGDEPAAERLRTALNNIIKERARGKR